MTEYLQQTAEECFGIKTDPNDINKLYTYIIDTYGKANKDIIAKVFSSGEAAGFLTVNETYFFREPAHFSFLLELLPLFEKTGIQILSAAVGSGCEAYSIAMLIETYNKNKAAPLPYHIDAFDINPKVIQTANKGIYSARTLREDGNCFHYMANPFLSKTENDPGGYYQTDHSLKKNINFFIHNVMDELPAKEYDLIFFRNAFIYFLPQYREQILSNLGSVLKENGIFISGVSETAGVKHPCLAEKIRNDVFYFEKIGSAMPYLQNQNSNIKFP